MASPSERPRNILLLTSPRVCAHLFTRMLSDQPRFKHGPAVYFFSPGARIMHVSRDVTAATWTEEDRRVTAEERTASLEYMEKFVKETNDEVRLTQSYRSYIRIRPKSLQLQCQNMDTDEKYHRAKPHSSTSSAT